MPDTTAESGARYDAVVEGDVMVTMRDGVRLATDIYRTLTAAKWLAVDHETKEDMEVEMYSAAIDKTLAEQFRKPFPWRCNWRE